MDAKKVDKDISLQVSVTITRSSGSYSTTRSTTLNESLRPVAEDLQLIQRELESSAKLAASAQSPLTPQRIASNNLQKQAEIERPSAYQESIEKLTELLDLMSGEDPSGSKDLVGQVRKQLAAVAKIESKLLDLLNASAELRNTPSAQIEKEIFKIILATRSAITQVKELSQHVEEFLRAAPDNENLLPSSNPQMIHLLAQLKKLSRGGRKELRRITNNSNANVRPARQGLVSFEKSIMPIIHELLGNTDSASFDSNFEETSNNSLGNLFARTLLSPESSQTSSSKRKELTLAQAIIRQIDNKEIEAEELDPLNDQPHLAGNSIITKQSQSKSNRNPSARPSNSRGSTTGKNQSTRGKGSAVLNNSSPHSELAGEIATSLQSKDSPQDSNRALNSIFNFILHSIIFKKADPVSLDEKTGSDSHLLVKKRKPRPQTLEFAIELPNLGPLAVSMLQEESKIEVVFTSQDLNAVQFIEQRISRLGIALSALGFECISCSTREGDTPQIKERRRISHAIA